MTAPTARLSAAVVRSPAVPAAERALLRRTFDDAATSSGGLLVATCHRLEVYVPGSLPAPFLEVLPPGAILLHDAAAAAHAISLAIGLESTVLAEDQVLHQLRTSLADARGRGLDATVERVMSVALRAGRLARSWRPGPPRSLADHALDVLVASGAALPGGRILVVGAGEMGQLAARAARRRGAGVAVASRRAGSALALASRVGAEAVAFDPGPAIAAYAGVVVALAGPWQLGAQTVDALRERCVPIVDLSAPPALPARLRAVGARHVVTVDELGHEQPVDERYRERLRALHGRVSSELEAWLSAADRRDTSEALMDRAERERRAELDRLWRTLPSLGPEERRAIEGMTRHLAERLLQEPLARLGRDRDGHHERAARELFGL